VLRTRTEQHQHDDAYDNADICLSISI
jgi:hypothetical protein